MMKLTNNLNKVKSDEELEGIRNPHFHGKCKKRNHLTFVPSSNPRNPKVIKDFYCVEHKVAICRCGWEWGFHPAKIEFDIKKECAWCGALIPGTKEDYMVRGNCCSACSSKYSKSASSKKY